MAGELFSKAMKDARLSISVSSNGTRSVGGNAAMDREQMLSRPSNYGNRGGRWIRGGFRGGPRDNFRGGSRGRGYGEYNPRSRFSEDDDGDLDMVDQNRQAKDSRFNPYGDQRARRDRSRSPDRHSGADSGWWKITIPDGRKHSEDWLLNRLKSSCDQPFEPVEFHKARDAAHFFVSDESAADALKKLSSTITTRDGSKITILVRPSPPPRSSSQGGRGGRGGRGGGRGWQSGGPSETFRNESFGSSTEATPEMMEKLKECLSKRYDGEAVKIDLSDIFHDQVLKEANIEAKLWNVWLMNAFLKIIHELCPQLKVLDISNNRLRSLNILQTIPEMCPNLTTLDLSRNCIARLTELNKIKSLKSLTKINLKGNPMTEGFAEQHGNYISEVRQLLPNILELDGVVLPAPIGFAVTSERDCPQSQGSFSQNHEATTLVCDFLKQFFAVYDKPDVNDRQLLLHAYHNEATFSIVANTTVQAPEKDRNSLQEYFKWSRNLKKIANNLKRKELIKHKKLAVVACLAELPRTKHLFETFALDMPLVQPSFLCFTVRGVFLEGEQKVPRGFSRTFVAVPDPTTRLLIINDQLQIRNPTEEQRETLESLSEDAAQISDSDHDSMVKRFSMESKMNLHWSKEALGASNWNYDEAARRFAVLHAEGKIPHEAFVLTIE